MALVVEDPDPPRRARFDVETVSSRPAGETEGHGAWQASSTSALPCPGSRARIPTAFSPSLISVASSSSGAMTWSACSLHSLCRITGASLVVVQPDDLDAFPKGFPRRIDELQSIASVSWQGWRLPVPRDPDPRQPPPARPRRGQPLR